MDIYKVLQLKGWRSYSLLKDVIIHKVFNDPPYTAWEYIAHKHLPCVGPINECNKQR